MCSYGAHPEVWDQREMDGGEHRCATAPPRTPGLVLIDAELWIRDNNRSSGATCLPGVDFPSSPFLRLSV